MSKKLLSLLLLLTLILSCGFTCQKKYPVAKPDTAESEQKKEETDN